MNPILLLGCFVLLILTRCTLYKSVFVFFDHSHLTWLKYSSLYLAITVFNLLNSTCKLCLLLNISQVQVMALKDIIRPPQRENFNDVYMVYELMDTDLHQIIQSTGSFCLSFWCAEMGE